MPVQRQPYVIKETPGKKAWCACGESEKQPYCDGSHSRNGTGKTPTVVNIEAEKTVAWCGCKESRNKPYCDGSHSKPKS